jgi:hypothetical protein
MFIFQNGTAPRRVRVALVADTLTQACMQPDVAVLDVTPQNYRRVLTLGCPDVLWIDAAWEGHQGRWKYQVAAYPDHPQRSNAVLAEVVAFARSQGIPTVFWNKEDGVHFERFIDSAALCDHIFTVDETAVPRYQARLGAGCSVHTLMFGVQPALHRLSRVPGWRWLHLRRRRACFLGSYHQQRHPARRAWLDALFHAAGSSLGLTWFDRNSARQHAHYRYLCPAPLDITVRPAIHPRYTAHVYQQYVASLNVNTVVNSPSMCSRRLLEILASGGLAITTPAASVERWFAPFCHVVYSADEAQDLLARLGKEGPRAEDIHRAMAGAETVARHHTWAQRLARVWEVALPHVPWASGARVKPRP